MISQKIKKIDKIEPWNVKAENGAAVRGQVVHFGRRGSQGGSRGIEELRKRRTEDGDEGV